MSFIAPGKVCLEIIWLCVVSTSLTDAQGGDDAPVGSAFTPLAWVFSAFRP